MDLETFEREALAYWERIPVGYREAVSALVIEPGAYRKDEFEEGWVYGWCEEDAAVMAIPDAPIVSRITLFYGSFVEIARTTPGFDWMAELHETIRHELQHALEWRGGDDDLGDEDDVQDDNERRLTGLPFTPWFHRWGMELGAKGWLADHELFVEVGLRRRAWEALATEPLRVPWRGLVVEAEPVPADLLAEDDGPLYVPAEVVGVEDVAWPWDVANLVVWRKPWWMFW